MKVKFTKNLLLSFRIKIGLGILFLFMIGGVSWGQITGDFRTITSGNWSAAGTWERFSSGSVWQANGVGENTGLTPGATNAVFVQTAHVVTLAQNESCGDLHIATGTTAASSTLLGKIALASFTLSVNGKMRCYFATLNTLPGTSSTGGYSIYPFTITSGGKVSIVGNSRTVFVSGEWGATLTTTSTGVFPLEVNMTAGQTATFATNVKSTSFNLISGIVDAASLSFDNGTAGQGDITIAAGTTLISSGSGTAVFQRTGSTLAGAVNLNGTLRLTGAAPVMRMTTINFNGTVEYTTNTQTLVVAGSSGAAPTTYNNISIIGGSSSTTKTIANPITVNGKFLFASNTSHTLSGTINYGAGATLEYASTNTSDRNISVEWPSTNQPSHVILKNTNAATIGIAFAASTSTSRTIPSGGSMTLNGGGFKLNATNTLTFAGGSSIHLLTSTGGGFSANTGNYIIGTVTSDIITLNIGSATATPATIQSAAEFIGNGANLVGSYNLTIFPGFTYNLGNSPRTVANLALNGSINDAANLAAATLNVKGNITGTGTHTTNFTTGKIVMIGNTSSSNISGATFANLDLNDADGFALTGTPAITGTLSLTNGSLNNSTNNISLGNGATVNRSAGSFTANPSYGTGVNVNYTGTGSVNSGFEITPAAGSIAALSVTGSGGTYTLASSPSITSLTVNSGSTLNAAALTITNSGTSTINGNFKTSHASGVAGSISGSAPTIGSSSTVEYYSGSAQAVDLTSFANLTLSGAGAKTFSANTTVTGNFASSGGAVTAPTLMTFNGTAQNIAGLAFTDVTFSTSGTKSMTSDASVSGSLTVNGTAVLDADGTSDNKVFTLRSNSTSTALVAEGAPDGGYITGNITIERYTSDKRAWRLLSAPISSGQTIRKAWMEDSVNNNGNGTHITTFTGDPNAANFDAEKPASSIRTFANPGSTWSTTPNTTSAINAEQGYMLFVRGNRTIDLNDITAHTAATLRITGTLKQGTQSAVSVPYSATDYTLVGNPFASPIDYEYLYNNASPALSSSFYIWDANLAGAYGIGGYRLVTRTGAGTYEQTPAGGSAAANNSMRYIHSGQAFLANATSGGGTTSLVIAEAGKATTVSDIFPFTPTTIEEEMTINMSVVETDLSVNLTDGTRSKYNSGYDAALTDEDNRKISNFNENLGIARDGEKLIVERRPVIGTTDTTYLSISNMKQKNYQLDINTYNLNHTLLLGKIVDNFTATSSPLNLNGNTIFNFTVTSDPASSAADRFKVVFYTGGPLPVTFTSIKAVQQTNDIAVEWKVENQTNIKQYEVEKSTDGRSFTNVGTQIATGANGTAATYNWLDVHAVSGDNFYRVKSIGFSGDVQYTRIVKVRMGKGVPAITVYPNPVTDRIVTVQFTDMAKGNYTLNLVNNLGQTVQSKLISHNGANAAQSFAIDRGVAKGNYQLQVVKPSGEKEVMKLVIAE